MSAPADPAHRVTMARTRAALAEPETGFRLNLGGRWCRATPLRQLTRRTEPEGEHGHVVVGMFGQQPGEDAVAQVVERVIGEFSHRPT